MTKNDDDDIQTGTTEFKTVKAGCGFRFDPEELSEEAGFDFSQAETFAKDNEPNQDQDKRNKSDD